MNKLLVICGPTAIGKTACAFDVAKVFDAEIVSADSRQIYKDLDIVSGKDLPDEVRLDGSKEIVFEGQNYVLPRYLHEGVGVWLYDVLTVDKTYSAAHFVTFATSVIGDIWSEGKLPILVGGAGFYISALLDGYDTLNIPPDSELRQSLSYRSTKELAVLLRQKAPTEWERMNHSDRNNPRRLMRKIEISESKKKQKKQSLQADVYRIGLSGNMEKLSKAIAKRVSSRIEHGAFDEIRQLLDASFPVDAPGFSALGVDEVVSYVKESHVSLDDVVSSWIRKDIQYAKRQMTWFKKQKNITWFDPDQMKRGDIIDTIRLWYTSK